jgi:ubiquinone/menaquinone biosynthesis C-methylase UbiE
MRKESCKRLKHYFEKKSSSLNILEVGCGNGWLASHLASIPGSTVTGIDIHCKELLQARRVFNHIPNLKFVAGSIHAKEIENTSYDYIVFAASIQYFSSVKDIINPALGKLKTNGEIHIIDSVFYNPVDIHSAKERTAAYYRNLGFPEMTEHYFHHSINDLNCCRFKMLYKPSLINRLTKNKNPFPWLCIKKQ